jgi:hypothetical protein
MVPQASGLSWPLGAVTLLRSVERAHAASPTKLRTELYSARVAHQWQLGCLRLASGLRVCADGERTGFGQGLRVKGGGRHGYEEAVDIELPAANGARRLGAAHGASTDLGAAGSPCTGTRCLHALVRLHDHPDPRHAPRSHRVALTSSPEAGSLRSSIRTRAERSA